MKGLPVDIIGTDCAGSNSPTYRKTDAILRVSGCELFESSDERPPLCLIFTDPAKLGPGALNVAGGYTTNDDNPEPGYVVRVRAVPVDPITGNPLLGGMASGQFIETSDGRFPCHGPIPCHTRFEVRR
jgi:hypothetical protein